MGAGSLEALVGRKFERAPDCECCGLGCAWSGLFIGVVILDFSRVANNRFDSLKK